MRHSDGEASGTDVNGLHEATGLQLAQDLLPEEGLRLALAVGLDAADVVGCGPMQDLQKLLQGGLQKGETVGSGRDWGCLGASAGPWLVTTSNTSSSPPSPKTRILTCSGMTTRGSH